MQPRVAPRCRSWSLEGWPRKLLLSSIVVYCCRSLLVLYGLTQLDGGLPVHVIDAPNVGTGPVLLESLTLGELRTLHQPHGTFYLGPDSHSVRVPPELAEWRAWTPAQRALLDDEEVDAERERERCAAYKLGLPGNATTPRRRRLFLGSLIADDPEEVLRAVGAEARGVFHTVAYVESNATHSLEPRGWTYLRADGRPPRRLHQLHQLFGRRTKVSVDYYVPSYVPPGERTWDYMLYERLQREIITHRWRMNGMRPDDIGIIADADETFSRDFLRVLQVCDIPAFRRDQDCHKPIVAASSLILESSGECLRKGKRWQHPDAILGKCVDSVGNKTLHPPAKREWSGDDPQANITYGARARGYGQGGDYSLVDGFPLWSAVDIRATDEWHYATKPAGKITNANWWQKPSGYHFHNFFATARDIHFKYSTYGHGLKEAMAKPVWEIHEDLELAVGCAKGEYAANMEKYDVMDARSDRPIYFLNNETRKARHLAWQHIVEEEEEKFSQSNSTRMGKKRLYNLKARPI